MLLRKTIQFMLANTHYMRTLLASALLVGSSGIGFICGSLWYSSLKKESKIAVFQAPTVNQLLEVIVNQSEDKSIVVIIKNHDDKSYFLIPSFGFSLDAPSKGAVGLFKTAPHGTFCGFEIASGEALEFEVNVQQKDGFFEYERAGEAVYPAKGDQILLGVDLQVASFKHGNAFMMEKNVRSSRAYG